MFNNLGNFKNLYEEFKANNSVYDSEIFRYNKKEDNIRSNIKLLNDIINQIKNGQLTTQFNKDNIRPQFRDFIQFGENTTLFKILAVSTHEIYTFSKLMKSKREYKILYPEFVATVLQYLNILALSNLFAVLDTKKLDKGKGDIVKYKFKAPNAAVKAPIDDHINFDNTYGVGIDDFGEVIHENKEVDFIESYESKNSDNIKVINEFIISYLGKVHQIMLDYDELSKILRRLLQNMIKSRLMQHCVVLN